MAFMFDASSLATQFMVLCLGASFLSLLPLHRLSRWLPAPDPATPIAVDTTLGSDIIRIQDKSQLDREQNRELDRSIDTPAESPALTPAQAAPATAPAPDIKPMAELIVDLSDRRLYWHLDDQLYKSYPIAVGQKGWETPRGIFHVLYKKKDPSWQHPIMPDRIVPPGPDNPLGAAWIGFLVNGNQQIGFHGTSDESGIGQAISHGCIRLRNADILELYEAAEVGWVVRIRS